MARVERWIALFLARHVERLPRVDWPDPGSEFWSAFQRSLVSHGVTEAVADAASQALTENPPEFLDHHTLAFMAAVRAVWKASEANSPGAPGGDFATAQSESNGCKDCGGNGQVSVFHRTIVRSVTAHCECSAGRWLLDDRLKRNPEFAGRLLRLLDVKAGVTDYTLDRPALETLTDENGTPLTEVWARNHPAGSAAKSKTESSNRFAREVRDAAEFLGKVLASGPLGYQRIREHSHESNVSMPAIEDAARRLGVVRSAEDGIHTWALPEGITQ